MSHLVFPTPEQWSVLIDLGIVGEERQLTLVCPHLEPASLALLRDDEAETIAQALGTGDGDLVNLELIVRDDHLLIEMLRSSADAEQRSPP